jgi:protein-tyrosine phosphatase
LKSLYYREGFQVIHLPIPDFDVPSKEGLEEAVKKTVKHA